MTRHPKNRCMHPWNTVDFQGRDVPNRQDPTRKGFPEERLVVGITAADGAARQLLPELSVAVHLRASD
jgi:hypothetical protein